MKRYSKEQTKKIKAFLEKPKYRHIDGNTYIETQATGEKRFVEEEVKNVKAR